MIDDEILEHASQCAPMESCGYVVRMDQGTVYLPFENRSIEPTQYFRMAPEDFLAAQAEGEVIAMVHSHPGGLPYLSEGDRTLQMASALPWWLICDGDIHRFRCVPRLLGRKFEHGILDCYTLFRDAYELAGLTLPDFHRMMIGGGVVKICIWTTLRKPGFTGFLPVMHRRGMWCCAALGHP
ncbi:hypothetical protein ACS33_04280 [Edwardsiella ictaluri]|nr:hypothetical protein ABY58_03700 [Edwardsiella ictaluri]KOO55854.1 hypothetical protein ACS33_04280 [Edwardsiella ictaluri]